MNAKHRISEPCFLSRLGLGLWAELTHTGTADMGCALTQSQSVLWLLQLSWIDREAPVMPACSARTQPGELINTGLGLDLLQKVGQLGSEAFPLAKLLPSKQGSSATSGRRTAQRPRAAAWRRSGQRCSPGSARSAATPATSRTFCATTAGTASSTWPPRSGAASTPTTWVARGPRAEVGAVAGGGGRRGRAGGGRKLPRAGTFAAGGTAQLPANGTSLRSAGAAAVWGAVR